MSGSREVLVLGSFGRVPVDTLFQLFLETRHGDILTIFQTRCQASIGGWVYEAAACLAKYLETDHFQQAHCRVRPSGTSDVREGRPQPLSGRRVVELGAGTGAVGIMAAYLGASATITDLDSLVPLLAFNVDKNSSLITHGRVDAVPLCWGSDPDPALLHPDFLILANCIYYESGLETLLDTVLTLTSNGRDGTVILACYEERTKEISNLVSRWHSLLTQYFVIHDVDRRLLDAKYSKDYVRLVRILRRS